MTYQGNMTGAYGQSGYIAGFGNHEPPQESLDDQRTRLQQRAGKYEEKSGDDDDLGEMDWTVTYIDMVTLLMIFFVVLSFMSMIADKNRLSAHEDAVAENPAGAYSPFDGHGYTLAEVGYPANQDNIESRYDDPEAQNGTTDPAPSGEANTGESAQPVPVPQPPQNGANPLAEQLQQMVQQNNLAGQVEVLSTAGSVIVRISDKILFASGKAGLEESGTELVARLTKVLAESGGTISIEGHTDNIPISTALYPSNWELSAARASTVLRQLVSLGLPANRLRAIAYADTKPVSPNDSTEHRAENRRVELVISSEKQQ
jgi:chemotaxis protein MotB